MTDDPGLVAAFDQHSAVARDSLTGLTQIMQNALREKSDRDALIECYAELRDMNKPADKMRITVLLATAIQRLAKERHEPLPVTGDMTRYYVLMVDDKDGQTVLVSVDAKSPEQAQLWGDDCDRGTWDCESVLAERPLTMDQDAFNTMARNKDPVWYRE